MELSNITFGVGTFGELSHDVDGRMNTQAQVIRDVVAEGVLAEEVGLDSFAVGEHHRPDYAISSPETVLAAIAARTSRIRLASAVTVLSTDDPVRVFQRFSTLDAISNGRADAVLGRGSFTESFTLFGDDLNDYDSLFDEKLELFAALRAEGTTTWSGKHRAALDGANVYPRTENGLSTWVGSGGNPESALRAAHYGLPYIVAIIGGPPARFAPVLDFYRRALVEQGKPMQPAAVQLLGFVAPTDEEAFELVYEHAQNAIGRGGERYSIGREQMRAEFEHGAMMGGSPETVARRIADVIRVIRPDRFDLKYTVATMPHVHLRRCIELFGTEVVPRVRELLADDPAGGR